MAKIDFTALMRNDPQRKHLLCVVIIFIFSLGYLLFFSQCLPFFFDDREFYSSYIHEDYRTVISEMFALNLHDAIASGGRPVYTLYLKAIFPFFGYDYCAHRIAKAVLFSVVMCLFYMVTMKLFKSKRIALFSSLYMMANFPLYIQTLGYTGPHVIAEGFKLLAVLFFLMDITQEKTSFIKQGAVFIFSLLAIRSYTPAFSIALILPLFTILYQRKRVWRYALLFVLILLTRVPLSYVSHPYIFGGSAQFSLKFVNIGHVFFNDLLKNIFNPVPSYSELYYKSFSAIVTFFGMWLMILSVLFLALMGIPYTRNKLRANFLQSGENEEPSHSRLIVTLTIVWMISELPYYLFLPEHAIRYIMTFFVPLTILGTFLIVKSLRCIRKPYKWYATFFVFIMLGGALLTNISYVYAFRAGWGSSFIAFEKVMDYFAEVQSATTKSIGVLYYSDSVAAEYFDVDKTNKNFTFANRITYTKSMDVNDFREEDLKRRAITYDELYVLQRVTSISRISLPQADIASYPSLELVTTVEGILPSTVFDRVHTFLVNLLKVHYQPNKVFVYRYKKD